MSKKSIFGQAYMIFAPPKASPLLFVRGLMDTSMNDSSYKYFSHP